MGVVVRWFENVDLTVTSSGYFRRVVSFSAWKMKQLLSLWREDVPQIICKACNVPPLKINRKYKHKGNLQRQTKRQSSNKNINALFKYDAWFSIVFSNSPSNFQVIVHTAEEINMKKFFSAFTTTPDFLNLARSNKDWKENTPSLFPRSPIAHCESHFNF